MSNTVDDTPVTLSNTLEPLIQQLDAMQLAQLTALAYALPQLYFCREYLLLDEQTAHSHCQQRLQDGLINQTFTLQSLTLLLTDKEFFDSQEARLRLAPAPECEAD